VLLNLLRKLLFPVVPIYYLVTWFRNQLYDMGLKSSKSYDFPVIAVGNLSVGGTGKSPMIEYLIGVLKDNWSVATLSRGYKRKTKGFLVVSNDSSADEVGDEPLQFKRKFKNVAVGVDANRRNGIEQLMKLVPKPEVVLLDDAYQHRKVKAGFYILLTAYYDLYSEDIMLPTGGLREPKAGAKRANCIVVTKCPPSLTDSEKQTIINTLEVQSNQNVYFSSISYSNELLGASGAITLKALKAQRFTLVTGIANPKPLLEYYHSLGLHFDHISFPDHHQFTNDDLKKLNQLDCIVTTEKDYVRLVSKPLDTSLWYQPIKVSFLGGKEKFDRNINEFIAECP